ncbi:MAG TPA: NPCBM/NEW2 domain-containing protein [Fimbriimonadales bacterium]|nr:NPCBM/NEW2 domain-containing protein [Fimbriimonadales bacterium]
MRLLWILVFLLSIIAFARIPEQKLIRKEGQYVALELSEENWKILENPEGYLRALDRAYVAYADLVGGKPYHGQKITIKEEAEYPGGWAVAGQPIRWYGRYIPESLQKVNEGDTLFGILHEIGHDFDLDYKWVWHGEFFANFKMVYALEKAKLKVYMGNTWFDYSDPNGERIEKYYREGGSISAVAMGAEDEKPLKDWFAQSDAATHKFLILKNEIGWEPFKKTFRAYQALPETQVPETRESKLSLFIHLLSRYSGKDLWKRFENWGFPIIKPDPYDKNMAEGSFSNRVREASRIFHGIEIASTDEQQIEVAVSLPRKWNYGLRTHANSRIVYALNGLYETFEALVFPGGGGTVSFQVMLDGEKVWESEPLRGETYARPVRLNVDGRQRIELIVTDGGDGINWDTADWVEARLTDKNGNTVYLDDMTPEFAKQDYGSLHTKKERKESISFRKRAFPDKLFVIHAKVISRSHDKTLSSRSILFEKTSTPGIYRAYLPLSKSGNYDLILNAKYSKTTFRKLYPNLIEL